MMYICGKRKDDHLTKAVAPPKKKDPKFKSCKSENIMLISWLINSMVNDIGENFQLYGTAKEIWVATKETCPTMKIYQNCLKLKVFYMTYIKKTCLSLNTSTHSHVIGNSWKCSKMESSTRRSSKREEYWSVLWGSICSLMKFEGERWDPSLYSIFENLSQKSAKKKIGKQ